MALGGHESATSDLVVAANRAPATIRRLEDGTIVAGHAAGHVVFGGEVDVGAKFFLERGVEFPAVEEGCEAVWEGTDPVHECLLLCSERFHRFDAGCAECGEKGCRAGD